VRGATAPGRLEAVSALIAATRLPEMRPCGHEIFLLDHSGIDGLTITYWCAYALLPSCHGRPVRALSLPATIKPGAELFMTEARINRRLAAVLAADVVGYSRLMGADEAGTLAALKRHREAIFDPAVAAHNGRIVKLIGDGVIAEFGSVVDAVNCALSVQGSRVAAQDQSASQPVIVPRIGINLGDVIIEGDDIYGDGVNIADAWSRSPSPVESASPRSSTKASAIGSTLAFRMAAT
jgi:hypothetical protein